MAISSVVLRGCLPRRVIPLMVALGLCLMEEQLILKLWPYGYAGAPMGTVPGADPYAPQMTREQELDFLRSQAEALGSELDVIMKRLEELRK